MRRAVIAEEIGEIFRAWQRDPGVCRDIGREIARIYDELGAIELLVRLRTIRGRSDQRSKWATGSGF
jgi:hypothetical protein